MRTFLRCVDEVLVIGNDIQVRVLDVQPDFVRLAITDTGLVPSYREEVLYVKSTEELVETYGDSEEDLEFSAEADGELLAEFDTVDEFASASFESDLDCESDSDGNVDSPYDTGSGRYSIAAVRLF